MSPAQQSEERRSHKICYECGMCKDCGICKCPTETREPQKKCIVQGCFFLATVKVGNDDVCEHHASSWNGYRKRVPSAPESPVTGKTETREPHSINCVHCPHVLQYHLSGVLDGTKRGCTQCDCPGFETREPEIPATHDLKTWPEYFGAIERGEKRFELRKNDRNFQAGDLLRLREWNPSEEKYTGREMTVTVTYLVQGKFGIPADLCVMSIARSETRERVLEDALRSALEEYDSRKEDIMTMDYAYAIAEDTINKVRDALERKG